MYFRARYLSRKLQGAQRGEIFSVGGEAFFLTCAFKNKCFLYSNFGINESKIRRNAGSRKLCYYFGNFRCASRKKPTPLCSGPLLSHEWGKAATMTNEEYTKNEGAHIGTVSRRI